MLFAFHSNYGRICSCFDAIHERDCQQDRQTPHDSMAALMRASRDNNGLSVIYTHRLTFAMLLE